MITLANAFTRPGHTVKWVIPESCGLYFQCRPSPTLADGQNPRDAVDPPLALPRDRRCGCVGQARRRGLVEYAPGPQVWKPGPWRRETQSAGSGFRREHGRVFSCSTDELVQRQTVTQLRFGSVTWKMECTARGGDVDMQRCHGAQATASRASAGLLG